MSEQTFTPMEIYTEMQSTHYGKVDWLQKVASGKIQRPQHEIDRVMRQRDIFAYICSTYERKFAGDK